MHLSNQSLLVIILVGIIAGWLAGRVMDGGGFGLIGDLLVGLVGAFVGDWLLPRLGIHLGVGIVRRAGCDIKQRGCCLVVCIERLRE